MSELMPPAVARFTSDASAFIEGLAKANGATRDWQAELAKADLASRKTGASAEAASQRAAVAMKRATDAAKGLAAAQTAAADAAAKLAKGELSQEEAAAAATKATDAETLAMQAQARAALATERASIAAADAQARLAAQARVAGDAQAAQATKANAAWASVGAGLTKVSKAGAIAFAVLGVASIKLAGDFQQQTNVLVTAAGELPKNLTMVRNGILDIATQTGTAWQQVTEGVYVAEKAGYRGAQALQVVRAAAQGAKEEGADLGVVLNATTSVMASYGLKSGDAVRVTNALKTGAGEAKVTMQEYAGSLSTVLPLASAAKIDFADVAGALATLTQHGTTANEGTFELAGTIKALQAPTAVARKEMAQFGIDSTNVATNLGSDKRGLVGTIQYLSQTILQQMGPAGTVLLNTFNQSQQAATAAQTELNALPDAAKKLAQGFEDGTVSVADFRKESRALPGEQAVLAQQFFNTYSNAKGFQDVIKGGGPAAQTYVQALKAMLGGQLGLNTALQLTSGVNLPATEDRTKKVAAAYASAGKNVSGWEITQKNFNTRLDQFKQSAEAAGIRLGNVLIPPLETVLGVLTKHPAIIEGVIVSLGLLTAAWAAMKIGSLVSGLGTLASRILGVGTASATAAPEVAGLGAASSEVTGLGAAFTKSGLLRGGVIAVGIAALALASKQLLDAWSVHNLPAADALGKAIASGGLTGKPATAAVQQSLSSAKVGDNRGETQLQYFQRLTANGAGKDFGLSMSSLTQTIQKGDRNDLTAFLGDLDELARKTGANASTVQNLNQYYTALFNRFNTGRDAAVKYTQAQQKAADAIVGTSTNVGQLSKTLKINQDEAQTLAAENTNWHKTQVTVNSALSQTNAALTGNSKVAQQNRDVITLGIEAASNHAQAVFKDTGNVNLSNAAFDAGVKSIEDNAVKLGYNKQQVDNLIQSLLGVKNNENLTIEVTAEGTFNLQDIYAGGDVQAVTSGHHAAGGYIRGPGTGTSDSIPAWLSNGEYVIPAATVKQLGVGFFDQLRSGYAAGGLASFDASFIPNINRGLDGLESAMNSRAQQWFAQRRSADAAQLAATTGGSFGGSVSSPANEALANAMMAAHGWNARQISEVDAIWTQESGFNANAVNPDGGAYGIPQAYPPAWGHPYALGDAPAQIAWGINYIDGIGGPDAAYARKAATGTYAKGGLVGYASGGLVGPASGFLSDMATLTGFTRAQNTTLAYNRANISRAGRANVPGLERAAQTAAEVSRAVSQYFYAHKPQLVRAMHTGPAASRRAATAVYNQLSTQTAMTGFDAQQEAILASQLRSRFAGPEAAPVTFGAPTRDLSYLALAGATHAGTGAATMVHTIVNIDSKPLIDIVSKGQLRTESRNPSNGATRIRNRTP